MRSSFFCNFVQFQFSSMNMAKVARSISSGSRLLGSRPRSIVADLLSDLYNSSRAGWSTCFLQPHITPHHCVERLLTSPRIRTAHVTSVCEGADGVFHTICIEPGRPQSETDAFVLDISRTFADAVVTTAQIARKEPKMRTAIECSKNACACIMSSSLGTF